MADIEVFDKGRYTLGEGPYYDPRFQRLSWVDIVGKKLWMLQEGTKTSYDVGQLLGAAVPLKESDGFLLAMEDGLYSFKEGEVSLSRDLKSVYKDYWRSNDAKADKSGRLWVGAIVKDEDHGPEGGLFLYQNENIHCRISDTKLANGMAWSQDQSRFFFSDSEKHMVFSYDYDQSSGDISGGKPLFQVEDGVPDGMTIDSDDNLWVAIWGGNRIEKRDGRTGKLLEKISLPATQVSSCCFGDEDYKTLYITSAAIGQTGEYDGCIFRLRTDVTGVAPDYVVL